MAISVLEQSTYDQIKLQLKHLKQEQKELQEWRAKDRQVESASILQLQQQHQQELQQQQQECRALQQRLTDSVERAARVRQHAQKENAALSRKVAQLEAALEQQQKQHQQEVLQLGEQHAAALAQTQQQAADAEQAWTAKHQEEQQRSSRFIQEVQEWARGEVEGLQAASAERLTREREQQQHWQVRCSTLQEQLEREKQERAELLGELQAEQLRSVRLEEEVQQLQQALRESRGQQEHQQADREEQAAQLEQQLLQQQADAESRVGEAKSRHAAEMDLVKDKLQQVMAKKDAVISGLRAELHDVATKLRGVEQVLLDLGADIED